jgi:transposase
MCYGETGSVQEVCRKFGISRKTFYKWLKRYRSSNGNSTSLQDQSRRPHHFPNATPGAYIALLKRLREETGFGQRRLRLYLQEHYNISISERTIWKILKNSHYSHDHKDLALTPQLAMKTFGPLLSEPGSTPSGDLTGNPFTGPIGE